MAKSRRILSVLLAILMVLTIVPAGLIGTAGAVSDDEIGTSSVELSQSFLERPDITISSTAVIRTAEAANSQAAGTFRKWTVNSVRVAEKIYFNVFTRFFPL